MVSSNMSQVKTIIIPTGCASLYCMDTFLTYVVTARDDFNKGGVDLKKVCLLLPNGFESAEASVFKDVFGWNQAEGDGSTELVTV